MKYRHKPTVVDAEQYNGPGTLSPEFAGAICETTCELGGVRYRNGEPVPHIDTLHGPVQLEPGWWVARELLDPGRFYPIAPHVFDASYEAAPEGRMSRSDVACLLFAVAVFLAALTPIWFAARVSP